MLTSSLVSETKVLLAIFLSVVLFCGQAFSEIVSTERRDTHQAAGSKALSVALNLSTNKPRGLRDVNPAPDIRLLRRRIDALVAPYLSVSSFSGEILVAQKGKVIFDKGYGLANYEHAVPVTPQTKFYIASITKSFTAAAILLLQDRGKLTVNAPVSRFIPDFTDGDRITIHHLLSHTSGISDSLRFPDFFDLSKRSYATEEAVNLFRNKPLLFKPGERSSYSNSNYVVLAYIIEKVSGQSYSDFLKTNFLTELGMTNTGQPNYPNELITHLASGYGVTGFNEFETARYYDRSIMTGAGSLYSTAEDLSKWIEGLLAGRVLKKSTVEQMFKEHSDGTDGYAWTLRKLWNRDVIIENGWDGAGFAGTLMHFINEDLTVVVLCNLNISSLTGELGQAVSALTLNEKADLIKITPKRIPTELARKLVGKYKLGDDFYVPGTVLEIVERDGHLYEQQHNPSRLMGLIPVSDREFIHRSSWGRVKFENNTQGEVNGLLFYGRFKAIRLP